ncbi:hypothetical protein FB451DRAFT_1221067 [Mycena latifolia]|nr:hypothetical protein FB451DRAFT_1221067 [Mycena latifolia]
MQLSRMQLVTAVLVVAATAVSAAKGKAERLAACGPNVKIIGNATIEANGLALQYSVTFCPEAKPPAHAVEKRENGVLRDALVARQTCTQCPCANGSIECFCANTAGESGDSLFIYSCSNSSPPNPNLPIPADCAALANLMVNGAPGGPNPNLPVMKNGYYNIPVGSIVAWEFQGCGLAFFNDVGSTYNVCAKDLANSVKALAAYCPDVNNIDAQFQNDPFKSLLVYNPAELH